MPAIPVLAGMEVSGVVFLPERLTRFSAALEQRLEGLRRTAVAAVEGRDFNLASPDQVDIGVADRDVLPAVSAPNLPLSAHPPASRRSGIAFTRVLYYRIIARVVVSEGC